jgi:signal transduction histidine kinase
VPDPVWARRPPPDADTHGVRVGRWLPATLRDLTTSRLQLSAALHDGARPPATAEGAVQRLLLVFEELVSNALRHGRAPVEVSVTRIGHFWLLQVSDSAADVPPTPAVGRDAARGGLGLPLVAQLSGAHGWTVDGDRKVVWARIDLTRAERPPLSRPGGGVSGHGEGSGSAPG